VTASFAAECDGRHLFRMSPRIWAVVDTAHKDGDQRRITFHYDAASAQRHLTAGKRR